MPQTPQWIGSPNRSTGRFGNRPEAIVIHIMDDNSFSNVDDWFRNPASKVSAHYGVGRDGSVHQYVREMDTAWHAGRVFQCDWALLAAKQCNLTRLKYRGWTSNGQMVHGNAHWYRTSGGDYFWAGSTSVPTPA